jgi:RNA polymerase sigma-70 factor (ECF subfamily)
MTSVAQLSPFLPQPAGVCWHEVLAHRGYLVRFARRKLHDPALAEDVVHDVFEAVLGGRAQFGGRSALRSWLVGILKNKLVDLIRDRVRYSALDCDEDESDEPNSQQVCGAPGPDDLAEQRERLALVMARIQQLPGGLRDAMQWSVLNDEPTEVVCERLGISQDSLYVRLHRARKQLVS